MPAYYRATLRRFASQPQSEIEATLTGQNALAAFPLQPEAFVAWKTQLLQLQTTVDLLLRSLPDSATWTILLEYPIPRVGRRIDAVLLARDVIVVIEMKTGVSPTSAAKQVDDYALNLACFHEQSHGRLVVPLVIADGHTGARTQKTTFDNLIAPCVYTTFADAAETIKKIFCATTKDAAQIEAEVWDEAQFAPIPPIVEAAVALYSNMNVFEIGHSCAAREDLQQTTKAIVSAVITAREHREKIICFVTGVPGAGKTLVGLNAVHEPEVRSLGSFLSGNGPLVKIIREALTRDVTRREKMTRTEAALLVQTFVQNVHRFADGFHLNKKVPNEHVIIFDEAQRAWDIVESHRAGRELSEPQMMLQIMDRHDDWAVIVALVGGGQEINRGEAGLPEWGRALAEFPNWRVLASPEVIQGGGAVAGFRLFETPDPYPGRIQQDEVLHLKVAVRAIRAERISDWVNAVLTGDTNTARNISATFSDPPRLTRSLQIARRWLMEQCRGFTRSGFVGSASSSRLRADGLEPSFDFHRRFDWENWFLDDDDDVRCSSRLEVFATQFEVQGLELDWVGLCWSEDFTWNGTTWVSNRFNNKRWVPRRMKTRADTQKHQFRVNGYRVLLTRARQGMIIYVPKPPRSDSSRLHDDLDRTAEFLQACGVTPVLC